MRRDRVAGGTIRRRLGVPRKHRGGDHGLRLLRHRPGVVAGVGATGPKITLSSRGLERLLLHCLIQLNGYSDFGSRHQTQPLPLKSQVRHGSETDLKRRATNVCSSMDIHQCDRLAADFQLQSCMGKSSDHRGSPENVCRSADDRSSAACGSGPF